MKFKASGLWEKIKFKPTIVLNSIQEIEDIVALYKTEKMSKMLDCIACDLSFLTMKALDSHVGNKHGGRIWIQHNRRVSIYRMVFIKFYISNIL